MPLSEYQIVSVEDFGGEVTRLDQSNVPLNQALRALNLQFNPLQTGSRTGFTTATDMTGAQINKGEIHSMSNWVATGGNYLVMFRNRGRGSSATFCTWLIYNLQTGGIISENLTPTISGMSSAVAATFIYLALYLIDVTTGNIDGVGGGEAVKPMGGAPGTYVDKLFAPPLSTIPTLGGSGGGHVVTAGLHRVGYLIQARAGFSGRLSPTNATTELFDTASSVTTAAGQQIDFSLTATFFNEASLVYPVMTTVDNPERYFIVPGVTPAAVSGGVHTITFTLDISDADLASTGTDVTDNQFLLTQSVAGTPPFLPFAIINFGTRVVYLTNIAGITQAYASEPNNGQQITADQNVLFLPGQRLMRTAGTLGRILYLLGPHWTYSYEDTGDVPTLWPAPRLVDGSIGTSSPHGFTINSATGFGWCADSTGLYAFSGGAYASLPVSYLSNYDWNRINWLNGEYWAATGPPPTVANWPAEPVKVIDDSDNKRVYVIAPLNMNSVVSTSGTTVTWVSGDTFPVGLPAFGVGDSEPVIRINGVYYVISSVTSTTVLHVLSSPGTQTSVAAIITPIAPTDILVFDYSNGSTWDVVKYSRWHIDGFLPGGGAMIQNPTTGVREFWLGTWDATSPATVSPLRQMNTQTDTLPFNDNGGAIDTQWKSALMPGMGLELGAIYYHYAQQTRVTGVGTLHRTLYSLDDATSVALPDITLAAHPGRAYTSRFDRLRSESASVLYRTNAANEHFTLSGLDHFYQKGPSRR